MKGYLGIDVGSISTNFALIDEFGCVQESLYIRTHGRPIEAVQKGMRQFQSLSKVFEITGVGATGSARRLVGVMVGADLVKNEIVAHATAALHFYPDVKTIIEIGGQDSKIIILRDGVLSDFAMNTVCAAGTGSFLDQQAFRLGIPIEEFGSLAVRARNKVKIAGRCTVFSESDMIHKAQLGCAIEDIVKGLCEAIVRNYLANVGKGKQILFPVVFQGGVAANVGVKKAFEETLGGEIIVPETYGVMGAVGVALLAKENSYKWKTKFSGFEISDIKFETKGFECDECSNLCEIVETIREGKVIDRCGDRCGKWQIIEEGEPRREVKKCTVSEGCHGD